MKKVIITLFGILLFSTQALAADNGPQKNGPGENFEERKAEVLRRIDKRIARNQEEKACVQAANNHEALRACREKFKPERPEGHEQHEGHGQHQM